MIYNLSTYVSNLRFFVCLLLLLLKKLLIRITILNFKEERGMKNRIWKRLLFGIVLIGCEWSALAQLQMVVDTETKEFFFRGSDSGSGEVVYPGVFGIEFSSGDSGYVNESISSDPNLLFTLSTGEFSSNPFGYAFFMKRYQNVNTGSAYYIGIEWYFTQSPVTFTSKEEGNRVSYASFPNYVQLVVEELIGSSMNLVTGSGFMPLEVVDLTPALSISNSTTYVDITFEGALEMSDDITDTNSWSTISSNSPYRVQKNMISDPAYYRAVE